MRIQLNLEVRASVYQTEVDKYGIEVSEHFENFEAITNYLLAVVVVLVVALAIVVAVVIILFCLSMLMCDYMYVYICWCISGE